MKSALGFIETKGLVGAIEAADAMLKAADVRLLEKSLAGGGLVTISVTGEVAAVQSSVDAAAAAIARIPGALLVSRHVIARPDAELDHIIVTEAPTEEQNVSRTMAKSELKKAESAVQPRSAPVAETEGVKPAAQLQMTRHSHAQLKKMNIDKLRQVTRELGERSLSEKKAASLDKKALIEVILNAYRQIEE